MNKIGFIVIFIVFASINFYIFTRGRQALPKSGVVQAVYAAIFVIFFLSFFVAMIFGNKLPLAVSSVLENIGGFWMIVFLYFLVTVLFADILRMTDHFFGIFPGWVKANYVQIKLIYFGSVILILMVLSAIGYFRFDNPQTVNLKLDVPKEVGGTEKLSIVAVSDIHLGNMIRKKRLETYVELINKQNPDIILIVGDLIDHSLHSVKAQNMDAVLRQLKAKYGVYAVLGNHDYFGNVNSSIEFITQSGITILRDTAVTIDNKFVLIGRDDYTNRHRKPISAIISTIDTNLPMILLDHQPVNLAEATENNIDLQISGHTHNGQIFPINLLVGKMFQLPYGHRKTGNTNFYVSSGLGLWGAPIRLGTQSELVKVELNFPR